MPWKSLKIAVLKVREYQDKRIDSYDTIIYFIFDITQIAKLFDWSRQNIYINLYATNMFHIGMFGVPLVISIYCMEGNFGGRKIW